MRKTNCRHTAADRIAVSGAYAEADLPGLLARVKPHVVWFPAQWPETYSFTLSAAIEAGLPVVASRIGSFVERLQGRPLSWLVDPRASAEEWLRCFDRVREALAAAPAKAAPAQRAGGAGFLCRAYLRRRRCRVQRRVQLRWRARRTGRGAAGLVDLRRPGRISIVVVPGTAGQRPVQPLRLYPAAAAAGPSGDRRPASTSCWPTPQEALRYRADIVATQRYAVPDLEAADALAAHCRRTGATLAYDLDDDLLHIPHDHPEAAMLRPKAKVVQRLLRDAGGGVRVHPGARGQPGGAAARCRGGAERAG